MSHQVVSANIIPNSDVRIFSPKTEGTRQKQPGYWEVCYHVILEV
jgi:hypothetical protein